MRVQPALTWALGINCAETCFSVYRFRQTMISHLLRFVWAEILDAPLAFSSTFTAQMQAFPEDLMFCASSHELFDGDFG